MEIISSKKVGKFVILEKLDGGVGRIILNQPEKRNKLDVQTNEDIAAALDIVRDDDDIIVVITTGAGDVSWSSGRDQKYILGRYEEEEVRPTTRNIYEEIREFPKVTIAAVNGYCLGGALSVYLSHDLGIASEEKAFFGLPEVFRGFVPRTPVATVFWNIAPKWAFDLLLTGENINARTAQMAGLVSRVVPYSQLQEAAYNWAKSIARWDPICLRLCKRAAYECMDQLTFKQSLAVNWYVGAEEETVGAKFQGLRDYVEGKGIKANKNINLA